MLNNDFNRCNELQCAEDRFYVLREQIIVQGGMKWERQVEKKIQTIALQTGNHTSAQGGILYEIPLRRFHGVSVAERFPRSPGQLY